MEPPLLAQHASQAEEDPAIIRISGEEGSQYRLCLAKGPLADQGIHQVHHGIHILGGLRKPHDRDMVLMMGYATLSRQPLEHLTQMLLKGGPHHPLIALQHLFVHR